MQLEFGFEFELGLEYEFGWRPARQMVDTTHK